MPKRTELDKSLEEGGIEESTPEKEVEPMSYKMPRDSRIPVSKHTGKLWKSRRDQALAKRKRKKLDEAWSEAIHYYKNDQLEGRNDGDSGNVSRVASRASRLSDEFSETENIVFANTNSLVPALYAKNPEIEITSTNPTPSDEEKAFITLVERLGNTLAGKKAPPGINLKPIIRRCVTNCALTNRAITYTTYIPRAESSEQAILDLQAVSQELAEAEDQKEIIEIEGKLMALEEKVSFLSPPGPSVRWLHPTQVVVDQDSEQPDRMDAKWMMHYEFIATDYLKAVYATERGEGENERYYSIFQPTHVMRINTGAESGIEDEINSFSLLDGESDHTKFGFEDEDSYHKAQRTKVWFVWDKTTRRLLLFNDKDWSWPIWVWDDPLHLDSFFPYDFLEFYTDPEDNDAKGEVTYYLDQQDAINEVNDEERKARRWARFKIMYNKRLISEEDAMKYVQGVDGTAVGIDLEPDVKLTEAVFSAPPPSVQFAKLFDKTGKYQAIDRISSTNEIGRGGEYKTNTTNKAIEQYNTVSNVRLDEKIDAIEDFIGSIMWKVVQLCLMNMSQETVASLVGPTAQMWRNMLPDEVRSRFSVRVEGGSTQKPTSQAKKKEAIEVGQVLGQFARITPVAALVAIQVMERAFDEIVIREEDWAAIRQSMMQRPAEGAGPPQGQEQTGQVEQLVDTLPPQAKQALGTALAKGVPVREALPRIAQMAKQGVPQQGRPQ